MKNVFDYETGFSNPQNFQKRFHLNLDLSLEAELLRKCSTLPNKSSDVTDEA